MMNSRSAITTRLGDLHIGYDSSSPDPGEFEEMRCRVCDSMMEVTRNASGPTSSAMAMRGSKRDHDHFFCGHAGKDWHNQAIDLMNLRKDCPSRQFRIIIDAELSDVLKNRKPSIHEYTEVQEKLKQWPKP